MMDESSLDVAAAPDTEVDLDREDDKSSATEGPDSPDISASSSPVPMMLPSSPTTDFPPPRYSVKFTDNVTKDGDAIKYTINVRKLHEAGDILTFVREYEDLQFLDHQLNAHNRQAGIIFPSLPIKPATDPAGAESRSKKQLGSNNRSIIGDSSQWGKDCRMLEKYLEMIVSHPILGKDQHLSSFLENSDPPPRPTKLKKGWLSGVKDRWDARNYSAKDCDEWFAKERDWATTYNAHIKDASDKFNNVVNARLRLVQQMGHLAGALNITVAGNEGANGVYNKLNTGFSGCMETAKAGIENEASTGEATMGSYLDLYSRCLEQENAMLLRRTCLMVEHENACKAVEKARPNREEAAKTIRDEAEKEFQECTEVAKSEIKAFHQRRLSEFRQSMLYYVEGQIKCSRENYSALSNCLNKIKDFPLPQVKESMFDPNDNDKE